MAKRTVVHVAVVVYPEDEGRQIVWTHWSHEGLLAEMSEDLDGDFTSEAAVHERCGEDGDKCVVFHKSLI